MNRNWPQSRDYLDTPKDTIPNRDVNLMDLDVQFCISSRNGITLRHMLENTALYCLSCGVVSHWKWVTIDFFNVVLIDLFVLAICCHFGVKEFIVLFLLVVISQDDRKLVLACSTYIRQWSYAVLYCSICPAFGQSTVLNLDITVCTLSLWSRVYCFIPSTFLPHVRNPFVLHNS